MSRVSVVGRIIQSPTGWTTVEVRHDCGYFKDSILASCRIAEEAVYSDGEFSVVSVMMDSLFDRIQESVEERVSLEIGSWGDE